MNLRSIQVFLALDPLLVDCQWYQKLFFSVNETGFNRFALGNFKSLAFKPRFKTFRPAEVQPLSRPRKMPRRLAVNTQLLDFAINSATAGIHRSSEAGYSI
jgi:hypothetical protein